MVKSSKNQLEEDEDAGVYDELMTRNNSSSCRGEEMKGDGKSSEQRPNTHRSKHSETEQRRRSKINERFQMLRDLIPQNDQKRDKASFLLEVIEYIQFLREKLQMYEGPYQGWTQEPTKLMPWRSNNGCAETYMGHSQALKNDSGHENNVVNPGMLTNAHSMESDLGTAAVYKSADFTPGSATVMVPENLHAQQNIFAPVGGNCMSTQPLQESVSDVENMIYQPQTQLWQGRSCTTEAAVLNGAINDQDLMIETGSSSLSHSYSHGVLNTLTEALRTSGVDLSQASISVQIDVGKRASDGSTTMASSSKEDDGSHYDNNQGMAQTGARNFNKDSDHAHKRLRTERS